jgi:hypothetical protein
LVSVRVRSEIEVGFAGHDNMHAIMLSRKREPVGGSRLDCAEMSVQVPMRRSAPSMLDGGKQAEQQESTNESSSNDEAESG